MKHSHALNKSVKNRDFTEQHIKADGQNEISFQS